MKPYIRILILCEGQAELRFCEWLTGKITAKLPAGYQWQFIFHPTAKSLAGEGHSALKRAMMNRGKDYDGKFVFYDAGDKEAKITKEVAESKYFQLLESQLFIEDFILALSGGEKSFASSKAGHAPKEAFKETFGEEAHKIDFEAMFVDDIMRVLNHPTFAPLKDFFKAQKILELMIKNL